MIEAVALWVALQNTPDEEITTWTLKRAYQTVEGIKDAPDLPGFKTEDSCMRAGNKWLAKQPHKFDWFSGIDCAPETRKVQPR